MRVLALNCGSSSVKYALFEVGNAPDVRGRIRLEMVHSGAATGIGAQAAVKVRGADGGLQSEERADLMSHEEAVRHLLRPLVDHGIEAVGHRVVHGGPWFTETTRVDEAFLSRFDELVELAPLHNPSSLAGIREARTILGTTPMVAVFDTAFHRTLPAVARAYALPGDLVERFQLRRYGFHGLAHGSSTAIYANAVGKSVSDVNLVTLHLGNGCSAAAIRGGCSIDTSMGFTPLEGLVMGTRCGDLDPALVGFLARNLALSPDGVEDLLNERAGLLGVSGLSSDMASLLQAERDGHQGAQLAVELFCYRARKYLGAYLAVLGQAEAVVFSGGIGEHAPEIRARICAGMEWCGLRLDREANQAVMKIDGGCIERISRSDAALSAFVAGIEEEAAIAEETVRCVAKGPPHQSAGTTGNRGSR